MISKGSKEATQFVGLRGDHRFQVLIYVLFLKILTMATLTLSTEDVTQVVKISTLSTEGVHFGEDNGEIGGGATMVDKCGS